MTDNVIIFGAGASYNAGIPLMSGFVEKMWEFAIRGKNGGKELGEEDKLVFKKALKIRNELDTYHGRVTFNDRNIEDILSILSFNMTKSGKNKNKFNTMKKAIERTIELSCSVKNSGSLKVNGNNFQQRNTYMDFWKQFFTVSEKKGKPPTLITFNYDLVLERALFSTLIGNTYSNSNRCPFESFTINYFYPYVEKSSFKIGYTVYHFPDRRGREGTELHEIDNIKPTNENNTNKCIDIEILKLHGSLNFPMRKTKNSDPILPEGFSPIVYPVSNPYILPPVYSKHTNSASKNIWEVAMEKLRQTKNIIIVGYSLPQTDIYMQYFLKTALGPNINLNKIFVFDPILFKDGKEMEDMKKRYACCFSPQLQERIDFQPGIKIKHIINGTFTDFVGFLLDKRVDMLF